MTIPAEMKHLLEALTEKPRKLDHHELLLCVNRDAMKLGLLMEKMKLTKLGQLTTEQRDLVALGWLCGNLHTSEKNMCLLSDYRNAVLNMSLAFTAHNVSLPVLYEVQEQVVVNYLDMPEFGHKGAGKDKTFTKNLDTIRDSEMRLSKIMKARNAEDDEDDDDDEMAVFANTIAKPVKKKKVLN